jgi:hypothetical protein
MTMYVCIFQGRFGLTSRHQTTKLATSFGQIEGQKLYQELVLM